MLVRRPSACLILQATLVTFSLSIRASVQIKDTVMDFGNLRWVESSTMWDPQVRGNPKCLPG